MNIFIRLCSVITNLVILVLNLVTAIVLVPFAIGMTVYEVFKGSKEDAVNKE